MIWLSRLYLSIAALYMNDVTTEDRTITCFGVCCVLQQRRHQKWIQREKLLRGYVLDMLCSGT